MTVAERVNLRVKSGKMGSGTVGSGKMGGNPLSQQTGKPGWKKNQVKFRKLAVVN